MKEWYTNFNWSYTKSTSYKQKSNATSSDPFAKTAYYTTRHQYILHFLSLFLYQFLLNETKQQQQSQYHKINYLHKLKSTQPKKQKQNKKTGLE